MLVGGCGDDFRAILVVDDLVSIVIQSRPQPWRRRAAEKCELTLNQSTLKTGPSWSYACRGCAWPCGVTSYRRTFLSQLETVRKSCWELWFGLKERSVTPSVGGCWTSTSCFRSPTVLEDAAEADGPPKRPDMSGDLQSFLRLEEGETLRTVNQKWRTRQQAICPV